MPKKILQKKFLTPKKCCPHKPFAQKKIWPKYFGHKEDHQKKFCQKKVFQQSIDVLGTKSLLHFYPLAAALSALCFHMPIVLSNRTDKGPASSNFVYFSRNLALVILE